jgi:predicted transposase/invertase (TIGR01784 family)
MRRDSIFYQLFVQSPTLLFDLLPVPPEQAERYRFDSVAVKEPKFEIDGVFLPPDDRPGIVYFCEVQFQRNEQLYERMVSESSAYFYRNRAQFSDWAAVVIYPSRTTEQRETHPYRALLESDQLHRVYLDELGDIRQLPLGMALMVLTIVQEPEAPEVARYLLTKSQQELTDPRASRAIIELLTTIRVYKFDQLSRMEVEAMLGMSLQKTRVYQEAKAEGEEIGREEGREEGQRSLVLLLLNQKIGPLPDRLAVQITELELDQLEALAVALLNFTTGAELDLWLASQKK